MSHLDALFSYVVENRRVCPLPDHWNRLYELLPSRRQLSSGGWEPPLPLILGGWWSSDDSAKRARLALHIRWAAEHGCA